MLQFLNLQLNLKSNDEVTRLQENYDSELEEATKSVKADLTEKVDTYLNYVVEEWMKEMN